MRTKKNGEKTPKTKQAQGGRTSLRVILPLLIGGLIVVVLAASSTFTYWLGGDLLLQKSKDEMNANADRIGESLSTTVDLEQQMAYGAAVTPEVRTLLELRASGKLTDDQFFSAQNESLTRVNDQFKEALAGTSGIESMMVMDKNGTVVGANKDDAIKGDRSDREYFQQVMKTGAPYVSDALVSKSTGNLMVAVAQPVRSTGGQTIGVYINTISTSFFVNRLEQLRINQEGFIFVTSRGGTVIYDSRDSSLVGQPYEGIGAQELTDADSSASIAKGNLASDDSYIRYSKIPVADWSVVVQDSYSDIRKPLEQLMHSILIVGGVSIVLALLVGFLISRRITVPIASLTNLFKQLAGGDLTTRAEGKYHNEFADLADSFNVMAERNRELIGHMNHSIEVLNQNTADLDTTSQNTARSIGETSVTTMEIAKAMESQSHDTERIVGRFYGIGEKIESLGRKTEVIRGSADSIGRVFESSGEVVNSLIDINAKNEVEIRNISAVTEMLADSSQRIGQITDAINQISAQTNLLALNASIEAARAGEHGRGFAVVADEIRKLAQQSSDQANEIGGIIRQTLEQVERSNESVSEIRAISSSQNEYVGRTQQSFEEILSSVTAITDQIRDMASEFKSMERDKDDVLEASQSLSASGEEVSASVEEVTATVQEQSGMVQRLAGMVQSIDQLTQQLGESAAKFKI
ncbi:methyl-accepting chemotaxis protein [Saccharibacillus sp. CPCC 101409]|uniref:methyl-accepting chemotaxis protein n=1 Tax=Saccharibacillus sp. CPCC 101409 TaxID=3058041 RepID=UPI0026730C0D|nr:methyl-accepting chemotaxis protein [Saccharibacillus sp. CPCC 101409]MDO3408365.1 methyl-accepting chemotaxis protein [Saccharibacillus sp. CPCC 101409]